MSLRSDDGSAGDADYGQVGGSYSQYRRPDPRLAARIEEALGDAGTIVNVGAGAGSYEPLDRDVTPVEPSASMRVQRPPYLAPAVDATAENLPFADGSFDAAMTTFSVHQWSDLRAGLCEMRRVTRGPIVILTCDPDLLRRFWLNLWGSITSAWRICQVRHDHSGAVLCCVRGLSGAARFGGGPCSWRVGEGCRTAGAAA